MLSAHIPTGLNVAVSSCWRPGTASLLYLHRHLLVLVFFFPLEDNLRIGLNEAHRGPTDPPHLLSMDQAVDWGAFID